MVGFAQNGPSVQLLGTVDDDRSPRKNVERSRGAGPRLMMVKETKLCEIITPKDYNNYQTIKPLYIFI
jgi:hypothetical protein